MGVDKERESQRRRGEDKCNCLCSSATVYYRTKTNPDRFRDARLVNSPVMQVYTAERDSPGKTEDKKLSGSVHHGMH